MANKKVGPDRGREYCQNDVNISEFLAITCYVIVRINALKPESRHLQLRDTNLVENILIKPYEFWHPRIFEFPFYVYLLWQCLLKRISVKTLAKANYALDHGEIGLGSKLESQLAFDQSYFLPTELVLDSISLEEKKATIVAFARKHGFPVILKSNLGSVGKGIVKLESKEDVDKHVGHLVGDYILQKFTTNSYECGVFYIRRYGVAEITGINQKHFPTITGNGVDSIQTLAEQHYRYSDHWASFLQELDTTKVLPKGEEKRLSFIGSHTLGCKFTDDAHLKTPALEHSIFKLFESQPGFNFGRVDVKAVDEAAFQRGEFIVIEVNGVASLPTHMFDPKNSIWRAYSIFLQHGRYLAEIAHEHKEQEMELLSYREVIKRVGESQRLLNAAHRQLMNNGS